MKKIVEIMNHIHPTEAQKNEMLENILSEKKEKHKFKIRYGVVAVAFCVLMSSVVFADEIKQTFYGLLNDDNIVENQILSDVYSDTDGHIRMSVKEVLSDKITSDAILEYTALDEKGQDWLDDYLIIHQLNTPKLMGCLKDDNCALYGVNYGCTVDEIKDYSSENVRVFKVSCTTSGENFGTDSMLLKYYLPDKWENQFEINVTESVQLTDIKIDNGNAPNKYYKPTGIKISPMSIMIYGKNCGYYESGQNEYGSYYTKIVNDEDIDSLYLVMKDGTKKDLLTSDTEGDCNGGFMLSTVQNPDVDYDLSIYATSFKKPMDLTLVDGIILDGIYYEVA